MAIDVKAVHVRPAHRWIRNPTSPVEVSVQARSTRPPPMARAVRFSGTARVGVVPPDDAPVRTAYRYANMSGYGVFPSPATSVIAYATVPSGENTGRDT